MVQWLGLYASTVDGGGGVTRVCSLIWELVSHTLLSVVKENRITWGTLKNSDDEDLPLRDYDLFH